MNLETELLSHVFYKAFTHWSLKEGEGRRDNLTGLGRQSLEPGVLSTVKHHDNTDSMDSSEQKGSPVSHPVRTKDLSTLF